MKLTPRTQFNMPGARPAGPIRPTVTIENMGFIDDRDPWGHTGWIRPITTSIDHAFVRSIPTCILQLMLDNPSTIQPLRVCIIAELAGRTATCPYCDATFQGAVVPPHDAVYDGGEALCPGGGR